MIFKISVNSEQPYIYIVKVPHHGDAQYEESVVLSVIALFSIVLIYASVLLRSYSSVSYLISRIQIKQMTYSTMFSVVSPNLDLLVGL